MSSQGLKHLLWRGNYHRKGIEAFNSCLFSPESCSFTTAIPIQTGYTGKIVFKTLWHHCQEDQKEPLALRGEFESVGPVTHFPGNKYSGSHRDIIAARLNKRSVPWPRCKKLLVLLPMIKKNSMYSQKKYSGQCPERFKVTGIGTSVFFWRGG